MQYAFASLALVMFVLNAGLAFGAWCSLSENEDKFLSDEHEGEAIAAAIFATYSAFLTLIIAILIIW